MSKENNAHAWKDPAGIRELTAEERACVNGGLGLRSTQQQSAVTVGWVVYDDNEKICYDKEGIWI